ncbi:MAG: gliding motility-associated C-terminal domain-containing protein [Lishizhenia sp.]
MKSKLIFFLVSTFHFLLYSQEIEHNHSQHHSFIENKGQWNKNVLFKKKMNGGNLWIEQGKMMFHLMDFSNLEKAHLHQNKKKEINTDFKQDLIHLNFIHSNTISEIEKELPSKEIYNYFIGKNKNKWQSYVKGFQKFTLKNFYDNVDFVCFEEELSVKYEFHVAPKTNPKQIQLEYVNHQGLKIDKKGNLIIETQLGNIIEKKPYAYQIKNGKIVEVSCDFKLTENYISFQLGTYDENVKLIIDPVLVFATFCGSTTDNFGMTATYGYDGTAYAAGMVYGNNYPTPDPNAFNVNSNFTLDVTGSPTTDAYISKYSEDGTTMLWTTFIGGGDNIQGTETAHSLICDKQNNIYLYGVTSSLDFPIQNGFQTAHAGGSTFSVVSNGTNFGTVGTDIFIAKVSSNGQDLLGSTYVGGSGNDGVNYKISSGNYTGVTAYDSLTTNYGDQFRGEIMLDSINNIIIASCTRSSDFPTQNAFQTANAGQQDGVVFKLNNDFSGLQFSSYFGGSENDACYSVKIDSSANIVFTGGTSSNDLQNTAGGFQDTYQGGKTDGFIAKLTPNGNTLSQTTYIGTSNYDQSFFVEIDRLDNIFVVGQSTGGNFPVTPGVYSNPGSSQFLAKLTPDLSAVLESTVFGSGSSNFDISPSAFLVDICGNIYVSGWGANILQGSPIGSMPTTSNAFQTSAPNGFDFYLIVLERQMQSLLYGTFMGGPTSQEHVDGGTSRFDKNGVVYQSVCGGCGGNSDFPTTPGAWSDQNLASNCNNLVFKFDFELIPKAEFTIDDNIGCASFEVEFDNFSSQGDQFLWDFGNGNLDSTTFEPTVTYTTPGLYDVFLYVTDSVCLITDTAQVQITVTPPLQLDALQDIVLCSPLDTSFTANSFGTATSFIWSSNSNFTDTLNTTVSDSTLTISTNTDGTFYVLVSNPGCERIDSASISFTSAAVNLEGITGICLGENATINATSNNPSLTLSNFSWTGDSILISGQGTPNAIFNPTVSQYVYLNVDVSNGCTITDSIFISVSNIDESSVIGVASEYTVPTSTVVTLSAAPSGYNYSWSPQNELDNPNAQQTTATINETTLFTLSVSDGICTKQDTVLVKAYTFVCGEPFVYIPNAFSPDGDGNNDILFVRSTIVERLVFKVFNRWGELVFESNSINRGWDGTYKGKLLDPDTYDYYIEADCIDGQQEIIKGNVTLIR